MADAKIPFIPHADFESACEQDFAEIDCALYVEEEDRALRDAGEAAATFLTAVEECRILTFEGEQFLFKRLNFLRFRAHALTSTLRNQRRPRKTKVEIQRLLDEANDTREEIARSNLRLIAFVCRKRSTSSDEFDEFVAEANTILLNAIDKFDFSRGYRFSTYLTHAVQRHLARLIGRASKRRTRELSDGNEALSSAASVPDSDQPSQSDVLAAATVVLDGMEQILDERECFIVRGRFGLDGSEKGKSLRALGDEVGISKERARQILYQSLEKLAQVAKPFESMFAVK
ncbi:sigma-70 family RNA polymerase sigma factor [Allorhodopirellula solitaria]|uniref:RNA polymerase sigma factor SigA n=1 Tax=Allorhodopirellula solitaria TaxID=2527987 RepID=A0A5C5XNW2_9BACT|nr:sigma-70 family RNA polymerase sigma factor [Allorhodopirellula solitaria]TWT64886.1 RNA polymerase sigma factor SigA [Allorhodopirellula solitaria]